MRVALVGAGSVAVRLARLLMQRGQDVVIVDCDKERIEELSDTLDCGFLKGDGSNPAVLKDVGPEETGDPAVGIVPGGFDHDMVTGAYESRQGEEVRQQSAARA